MPDSSEGWEFCDVGNACQEEENQEKKTRIAEVLRSQSGSVHSNADTATAPPNTPFPIELFPTEGLYAHYTTRGWEATNTGQWDDESGNERHSLASSGLVLQGLEEGQGTAQKVGFLTGSTTTSVTFPMNTIPDTFSICSVSRYR